MDNLTNTCETGQNVCVNQNSYNPQHISVSCMPAPGRAIPTSILRPLVLDLSPKLHTSCLFPLNAAAEPRSAWPHRASAAIPTNNRT